MRETLGHAVEFLIKCQRADGYWADGAPGFQITRK